MLNYVVFGPASVGKSSCIGYMLRATISEREYEKRKKEVSSDKPDYDLYENKYACLVDVGKNEGIDERNPNKGSSKRMHINKIQLTEHICINLIDTPGFQHTATTLERNRGIAYGDIGIFMLEMGKIVGVSSKGTVEYIRFLQEQLSDLISWILYKDLDKLIVVISKMDINEYEQTQKYYDQGKEFILKVIKEQVKLLTKEKEPLVHRIPIIPISIDFRGEKDSNILTQKGMMQWYNGPTLLDAITSMLERHDNNGKEREHDTFLQIREYFTNPDRSGPKLRGKVISGELAVNDQIKLVPLSLYREKRFVLGRILSLRSADGRYKKEPLPLARAGDIIGMGISLEKGSFSDYWPTWKDSQNALKTLCAVKVETKCAVGSLLRFSIDASLWEYCRGKEGTKIGISWFGSAIKGTLISRYDKDSGRYIIISFDNQFAIPIVDNHYLVKEFVLFASSARQNEYGMYSMVTQEWLVTLDKIGDPVNINIYMSIESDAAFILEKIRNKLHDVSCDINQPSASQIILSDFEDIKAVLGRIRRRKGNRKPGSLAAFEDDIDIKVRIRDVTV